MQYPVWEVPWLTGGILIALVSIAHVFIAHFAVGGGLFLVLTERQAHLRRDSGMMDYVKLHTRFFVLLSLVLGAVTGVGIWLTIGLVSPAATSALIRNFVWVWSMEYIPFFVEIIAATVYYYAWERISFRLHQFIGWIYVIAAWSSLFFINGILTFMLTPGRWLASGQLWDAFFNPTMWPSFFLRSFVAVALAGLYGLVTSSLLRDEGVRRRMVRYSASWLIPAFAGIPLSALWYFSLVPAESRAHLLSAPVLLTFLALSAFFSTVIFVFSYFGPYRDPQRFSLPLALLFLLMGFAVTGTSEWVREAMRRPFLINQYLYSNQIRLDQVDALNRAGMLAAASWSRVRAITPENRLQAGAELFRLQCSSCHAIDGYNGIRPLVAGWPEGFIDQQLRDLDTLKGFMPPFAGTDEERRALAAYLASLGAGNHPTIPTHPPRNGGVPTR